VWGYPCESKSSPAHYSKKPPHVRGLFLCVGFKKERELAIAVLAIADLFKLLKSLKFFN